MAKQGGRGGAKKKEDPELQMKLKFKAKCQFRALYRLVLANTYWLIEDIDHYEGVDDVKRRVQQAVRGKHKKKQLLNIRDKALLNKDAKDRTEAEKKYLYRILGGLKCFKKYPNHVKKKLAAVTYFKYYSPGRVIVRQHHEGHAMYFIVTGDVVVSQLVWDGLLQQFINTDIGVMHPGDMFGEVSLLHNIPRTATVTTKDHCELLALMEPDFRNVLLSSVQKQWDQVRHAMSAFTYFDHLDDIGRREGCIVAKLKTYETNDTLLGDGQGVPNHVYFILKGRCQMIESLQITVTKRLGVTHFKLYDPYVPPDPSEQDLDKKYFAAYKNLDQSDPYVSASTTKEGSQKESKTDKAGVKGDSILKTTSSSKQPRLSNLSNVQIVEDTEKTEKRASTSSAMRSDYHLSIKSGEVLLQPSESLTPQQRESVRLSTIPEIQVVKKTPVKPPNTKTFFMQVVQYNPGASFGFGENMRDRRIIALTQMECLLLPKIWLLQRNTANIWTRIQYYLTKKIPEKKTLFKEFVNERRWQEYTDQVVEDVVNAGNTVNATSVHDVPYSIRLEEMYDDY